MIRTKPVALRCAAVLVLLYAGCAGQMTKKYDRVGMLIRHTHENNRKACAAGCILFEGDSNLELIYVQDYFAGPACNYARRGSTTDDLLARKEQVARLRPGVIILLAGGNDLIKSTPYNKIAENYAALIRYYRSVTGSLYCISNLPLSVHPKLFLKNSDIIQLNRILENECGKQGVAYVNAYPELLKNGILNPGYAMDPVHLNQAGQKVLMNILKKQTGR